MVYLFLTNGFEEIEAVDTIDILRRGGVDVTTVSITGSKQVTGSHNITLFADAMIEDITSADAEMLIFPGGPGVENLLASDALKKITLSSAGNGVPLAAICAAPSVLGAWGLLKGKKAVCFPGYEDKITGAEYTDKSVVNDGNVITSKGAGTAGSFAFEILCQLRNRETALRIRKAMQYEQ